MQPIYRSQDALLEDAEVLYMSRWDLAHRRGMYYSRSDYDKVHVDPRGKCGNRGKVLCYRKIYGVWQFSSKHKRATIWASNCKEVR
jgi:hypothetical protein